MAGARARLLRSQGRAGVTGGVRSRRSDILTLAQRVGGLVENGRRRTGRGFETGRGRAGTVSLRAPAHAPQAAFDDEASKRRVLTVRGRTSAVLGMFPIASETTEAIVDALRQAFPLRARPSPGRFDRSDRFEFSPSACDVVVVVGAEGRAARAFLCDTLASLSKLELAMSAEARGSA